MCGYPFNTAGWADSTISDDKSALALWWPYEQMGYWVDGNFIFTPKIPDTVKGQQKRNYNINSLWGNKFENYNFPPC